MSQKIQRNKYIWSKTFRIGDIIYLTENLQGGQLPYVLSNDRGEPVVSYK